MASGQRVGPKIPIVYWERGSYSVLALWLQIFAVVACLSARVEIMPGEWAEGAENDRWKLSRVRRVQCNLLERRMGVWLHCLAWTV